MRQSQLRRITGTIAYRMAETFGFQKQHPTPGEVSRREMAYTPCTPGEVVLSNVANQVHHAAFDAV